ncbi:hypothetical protein Y032_0031g2288 [Ancylostoma ceylanicum]|uniref:Uncharacterized protein n=1 Tax=Ancylostoma ceylanicum TaxID=53326 RepID=A0A016UQM7_9BILA|nr:hypothetical protein Y032_0031g2288 [Ancylostoma ceylanicum]
MRSVFRALLSSATPSPCSRLRFHHPIQRDTTLFAALELEGGLLKPANFPSTHQQRRGATTPSYANKTAREKHRSVSAEEAAAVPDAVSTGSPDTDRVMKAQQPRFYGGPVKAPMPAHPPSSRSKTLAWFLADDLLAEKKGAPANGSMKTDGKNLPQAAVPAAGKSEDKKRRRALRRAKKTEAAQLELAEAEANAAALEDLFASDRQRVLSGGDDYWYYDVASDGYYYEQNGAKGWRRRMPNSAMQRIKEQEMAQLANGGKLPMLNVQTAAQAHALLQSALFSQPALKYYDANSDGFFYEMASVDGWKRRQPNKPVHQTLSNGLNAAAAAAAAAAVANATNDSSRASYGATLARGQIPRPHCVLDDSSASSSVSEDTSLQDVFGLDTAFSGLTMGCDSPFRPLNSTTNATNTTSTNTANNNNSAAPVSRPDSLQLRDQILPGFNADKFIQDLSFSGLDPAKVLGSVSRTPADPWASRCGGWALPPFDKPTASSTSLIEDDDNSSRLLKDLEKIWATPVGGLNA